MGLALASACASYLNVALLWRALKRDGAFTAQPGWMAHMARLGAACLAMVGVLGAGLYVGPDWALLDAGSRVLRLCGLIALGGASFVAVLFACGFRLRDLRHR
jgi:putative peptidoglycan lipid II flippase